MDKNTGMMPYDGRAFEIIPELLDDGKDLRCYKKIPLADLAALGIGFESISTGIQNFMINANPELASVSGFSGLYRVTVEGGHHLQWSQAKHAYLGMAKEGTSSAIASQAELRPVLFDPTMAFMAVAMMNIQHKLNEIQKTQEEILQFLEQKEKAELRGNIVFMMDIINNYGANWNNQRYLNNNHAKILDIKQKAEQSILFAQSRIKNTVSKNKLIKISSDIKAKVRKLKKEFEDYQLAVYTYAMASYIETLLLKNFDKAYMNNVAQKVEDYSINYRELYTDCYDMLSDSYDSSVDTLILEGISKAAIVAGAAIARTPIIGNTEIDENLVAAGEILGDSDGVIKRGELSKLVSKQSSYVQPFVDNIRAIGEVYGRPLTLLFDEENLYIEPLAA